MKNRDANCRCLSTIHRCVYDNVMTIKEVRKSFFLEPCRNLEPGVSQIQNNVNNMKTDQEQTITDSEMFVQKPFGSPAIEKAG